MQKIPDGADKLAALLLSVVMLTACGGGGGGVGGGSGNNLYIGAPGSAPPGVLTPAPAANGNNSIAVVVDTGPAQAAGQINIPYVSVTVCTPGTSGTTAACQTIDHVQLDTGSYGLRLLKPVLYSNLALPAVTSGNSAIGECVAFAIGVTWGSVRYADIYLGGEVARSVPIQDIGDTPGGETAVPVDCSSYGQIQDTQAQLGANGILGVGLFKNDCDQCLTASPPLAGAYYACTSVGCTYSDVMASQVVQNPVADFAQDNNGVLISLPSIGNTGAAYSNVSGTLTFGISTQSDNSLGGATVYATDQYGNIQTAFNSTTISSFIDSGSNALFFNDSLPMCTGITWAYCPSPSPLTLSASNMSASATTGTPVSFSIVGADTLNVGVVAANIAGTWTGSPPQFDWGLPFFFGRPVYTAISGAIVAKSGGLATGPFFAY